MLRGLALTANLIALAFIVVLFSAKGAPKGEDAVVAFFLGLAPLLSFLALCRDPYRQSNAAGQHREDLLSLWLDRQKLEQRQKIAALQSDLAAKRED